jgi:hypothetical protein
MRPAPGNEVLGERPQLIRGPGVQEPNEVTGRPPALLSGYAAADVAAGAALSFQHGPRGQFIEIQIAPQVIQ